MKLNHRKEKAMQISQNLKLKQSQSLVMTPQLQQAIKLLQLNNIELCELVEKELEENPFLEKDNQSDFLEQKKDSCTKNVDEAFQNGESQYEDPSNGDYENRWDQERNLSSKSNNFETLDPGSIAEQTISEKVTLKSFLMKQANITFKTPQDKIISEILIDYIQPSGWLTTDLVELKNIIGCDEQTLNEVLLKMQKFEPTGVFARNLTECLRIQLKNENLLTDGIGLLIENFDLLAKGEIRNLCKICEMSEDELTENIKVIKTLNPKPGSLYSNDNDQIFHPDVIVSQKNNQWEVELNNGTLPKIIVNENYITELEKLGGSENDKKFITESINSARWLMKAIEQRNLTTLKISTEIVEQQKLFFKKGVSHLKPMILKDVAKKIKMHESTVSRVTTGKLMLTPRGVFEMKHFFSA
ncbi:MAG: RNA polymerase sigma-54 factor, partial [Rickettsiales bacterium]|nr:RNA polymerase sigma-54 factor [Rickettsiales bacterium]